jgi:tetratricopeptide (TPR) repeat protein
MKKYFILKILMIFLALLGSIKNGYAGTTTYLLPMPMPTQYHNFEHYQQALAIWEKVSQKMIARSHQTQLPPMPMPNQYRQLEQYQKALAVWENVATTSREANYLDLLENQVIRITPLPMPTQYQKLEHYYHALELWVKVNKQLVSQHSPIQPPAMPMPHQYQNLEYYQRALAAWEEVFE